MTDAMRPLPFSDLLEWILGEYRHSRSIFGIPASLFYRPRSGVPFVTPDLFGHRLDTPIGPAAGPHTQLAQNIISAWLCGARFIELKTVQIMDQLEIPRPCIDMADEGYNVEWSQELRLTQSRQEYVKAWVLVHALERLLGHQPDACGGTIFNMSVGYDLKGIQSPPMTAFMDGLADASDLIAEYRAILERHPSLQGVTIPARVTNNVTLSTMHGCPPDDIERIAAYLITGRGLHTVVKLNPTLLGRDEVMRILHGCLGYTGIVIAPAVFDHDLQYDRALRLIRSLQTTARRQGVTFAVKLSNTLAMSNHRGALPGGEMYMSGRALYPVTVNLFRRLTSDLGGDLRVSFSAGADALNLPRLLACGALPVTVASDLLKPGGYARLGQYLENLERSMSRAGAASLNDYARDWPRALAAEAAAAPADPRYGKAYHSADLPKVSTPLDPFDCITAPCMEPCAIGQHVPAYAWRLVNGQPDEALRVILAANPLPAVMGHVCTQLCQTRCTQHNYEQPVAIRALKRFAAERGAAGLTAPILRSGAPVAALRPPTLRSGAPVAVLGSGPSGLAAAALLALNGVPVTVYETRDRAGGLLAGAIPPFRLPAAALQADLDRIRALGVRILCSQPARDAKALLAEGFAAVYVATGAWQSIPLGIPGEDGPGVYDALGFLNDVRRQVEAGGAPAAPGKRVLVIGGGNSAVDAARAALRLGAESVTIVYRRTRAQMPAISEELAAALAEGVTLQELTIPLRVVHADRQVVALECQRAVLGEPGPDGRPRPVPVPGSEYGLAADAIIAAVGQRPAFPVATDPATGATDYPGIFAGGDAVRGPATVIQAIADGKRAALAICRELGVTPDTSDPPPVTLSARHLARVKSARARREVCAVPAQAEPAHPAGFGLAEPPLTVRAARREAARCLQCASLCDKCVEVCPNRANLSYIVADTVAMAPTLTCRDGVLAVSRTTEMRLSQSRQIVHLVDLCNDCGNCDTFCVHQGRPHVDKPRLVLHAANLEGQTGVAYHASRGSDGWLLRRSRDGAESTLRLNDAVLEFEDDRVKIVLTRDWLTEALVLKQPFAGEHDLAPLAEMYWLLQGLAGSLPFLPYEAGQPNVRA